MRLPEPFEAEAAEIIETIEAIETVEDIETIEVDFADRKPEGGVISQI